VAVAASMLTVIYHMIRDGTRYRDLGFDYLHHGADNDRIVRRSVTRLKQLGYQVTLTRGVA
jgi:hypothetical protein